MGPPFLSQLTPVCLEGDYSFSLVLKKAFHSSSVLTTSVFVINLSHYFLCFTGYLTILLCIFRSHDCDIRIQLPNVSKEHARIDVGSNGEVRAFVVKRFNYCFTCKKRYKLLVSL